MAAELPKLTWVPSKIPSPLIQHISNVFKRNLPSALVLWGPASSCKSHALRDYTVKAQQDGKVVIYLDCQDCRESSFMTWFFEVLNIGKTQAFSKFGSWLPRVDGSVPVVIIDHLEDVLMLPDTKRTIVGLARAARDHNNFQVLVCISPVDAAVEVLSWNGGHKIK